MIAPSYLMLLLIYRAALAALLLTVGIILISAAVSIVVTRIIRERDTQCPRKDRREDH